MIQHQFLISVKQKKKEWPVECIHFHRFFCVQSVPISLFTERIVLSELVTACLFAVTPTNLSPSLEKRLPKELFENLRISNHHRLTTPSSVATHHLSFQDLFQLQVHSFFHFQFQLLFLISNTTSRIPLLRLHSTIWLAKIW